MDGDYSRETYSLTFPLSKAKIGSSLRIMGFVQNAKRHELLGMGLRLKTKLKVVNSLPGGNIVVIHGSEKIGLSEDIASQILVCDESLKNKNDSQTQNRTETETKSRCYLRDIPIGTRVRIMGFEENMFKQRQKLIEMGLNRYFELILSAIAPEKEKPIIVKVGTVHLSLSIEEADALIIKLLNN